MRIPRIATTVLVVSVLGTTAALGSGSPGKVTICHATGSRTNPYVVITPSAAGIVNGHLKHQDQRDIVPPFTFRGRTYSQNWTTSGQAVFAAGCHAAAGITVGGVSGSGSGTGSGSDPGVGPGTL